MCQLWMQRQDYTDPVRWIIVDDGQAAAEIKPVEAWQIEVIRPKPCWTPGANTQARNLRAGLERITNDDPLLIIEDDDHYAPGWISRAVAELEHHELVGQLLCRKYNVSNLRARELLDHDKASLCCTAMIGDAIRAFREVATHAAVLLDCDLWRCFRGHLFDGAYVTSIKCMPGRGGIDSGHRPRFGKIADPTGQLLRQWIGADAEYYRSWMRS